MTKNNNIVYITLKEIMYYLYYSEMTEFAWSVMYTKQNKSYKVFVFDLMLL